MPLPDTLLPALYAIPFALAMGLDIVSYRIPNWLTLGFALAFFPVALLAPGEVSWWSHLLAGWLFLGVGIAAFATGGIGGGDVKLMAAAALWLGLDLLTDFLILTAAFGGALGLALIAARLAAPALFALLPIGHAPALPRLLLRGAPVPYGIAIGAAGLLLAPRVPLLA